MLPISSDKGATERSLGLACLTFLIGLTGLYVLERFGAPASMLTGIALVLPAAICAAMIYLGRTMEPSTFFVAQQSVPSHIAGFALTAEWFGGAGLFLVLALGGDATFPALAGAGLGLVLYALFIGVPLRRAGALTVADFMARRFDSRILRITSATLALMVLIPLAIFELSLAHGLLKGVTGTTTLTALTLFTVAAALPLLIGGFRALTLAAATATLLFVASFLSPAITGAVSSSLTIPAVQTSLLLPADALPGGFWQLAAIGAFIALGTSALPQRLSRAASVRTATGVQITVGWALVWAYLAASTLPRIKPLLLAAAPVAENNAAVVTLLPRLGWLVALCASLSITMMAMATVLSHDIYRSLIARKAPRGRRMFLTRLLVVVFVGAVWHAGERVLVTDIMQPLMTAIGVSAAAVLPPLMAAIWMRRVSISGVLAGQAAGFAVIAVAYLQSAALHAINGTGSYAIVNAGLAGAAVSAIATVVISLVLRKNPPGAPDWPDTLRDPVADTRICRSY